MILVSLVINFIIRCVTGNVAVHHWLGYTIPLICSVSLTLKTLSVRFQDCNFLKNVLAIPWILSTSQQPQQQIATSPKCDEPQYRLQVRVCVCACLTSRNHVVPIHV